MRWAALTIALTTVACSTIQVAVRLRRDGWVVAEGRATWDLEADVEWWAEVMRAPYPVGAVAESTPTSAWISARG
ncbi:hypothetical protein [Candidatus Palauibacter sp.]|uniref:hypothetical protein n=1 Tax=Candidatus Palauibacter sp. TaxID=3101350 RepID=UPI003AF23C52